MRLKRVGKSRFILLWERKGWPSRYISRRVNWSFWSPETVLPAQHLPFSNGMYYTGVSLCGAASSASPCTCIILYGCQNNYVDASIPIYNTDLNYLAVLTHWVLLLIYYNCVAFFSSPLSVSVFFNRCIDVCHSML